MRSESFDVASIMLLHTASGLSLGMSVVVLADIIPWARAKRHPWIMATVLVGFWIPFATSGDPEIRRMGATAVSFYLAGLFLAYERYASRSTARERIRVLRSAVAASRREHPGCPAWQGGRCLLQRADGPDRGEAEVTVSECRRSGE